MTKTLKEQLEFALTPKDIISGRALKNAMENGHIVSFEFIKKTNNADRFAVGTRDSAILAATGAQIPEGNPPSCAPAIPYWDYTRLEWRSFYMNSVIRVTKVWTLEEWLQTFK